MVFIVIVIFTFLTQYFLGPWWWMPIVCYLVGGVLGKSAWGTFFSGFFAVFFVWAGKAFWADILNSQLLSGKIGAMVGASYLGEWLFLISALLGAIIGALACLSGYYVKRIFIRPKPQAPLRSYQ